MKSAWFWNTEMWAAYQRAYHLTRPEPESYKTSPLANDHDFRVPQSQRIELDVTIHRTQVIDLAQPLELLWRDVRKSYRPLIHKAQRHYRIEEATVDEVTSSYQVVHAMANHPQSRNDETFYIQQQWVKDGYGLLVIARDPILAACAYWIIYQGGAYYMSGPSIEDNVQHAVIWRSLELLKAKGIKLVELGQLDGETEKEKNIGVFKQGFGGKSVPFTIATRRTV